MAVSNNSIKAFTDAIRQMASQECKQIDSQTKLLRSQRLASMKRDIRHEYDVYIDNELSKIRTDVNSKLSMAHEQSKKELSQLRMTLSDEVFTNVENRVAEFVNSPGYRPFLVKSVSAVIEKYGRDFEFLLRPEDMKLADSLTKELGVSFSADSTVRVGGVKAYSKQTGTLIDDTLDVRIEAGKQWFFENSGLKV